MELAPEEAVALGEQQAAEESAESADLTEATAAEEAAAEPVEPQGDQQGEVAAAEVSPAGEGEQSPESEVKEAAKRPILSGTREMDSAE